MVINFGKGYISLTILIWILRLRYFFGNWQLVKFHLSFFLVGQLITKCKLPIHCLLLLVLYFDVSLLDRILFIVVIWLTIHFIILIILNSNIVNFYFPFFHHPTSFPLLLKWSLSIIISTSEFGVTVYGFLWEWIFNEYFLIMGLLN